MTREGFVNLNIICTIWNWGCVDLIWIIYIWLILLNKHAIIQLNFFICLYSIPSIFCYIHPHTSSDICKLFLFVSHNNTGKGLPVQFGFTSERALSPLSGSFQQAACVWGPLIGRAKQTEANWPTVPNWSCLTKLKHFTLISILKYSTQVAC